MNGSATWRARTTFFLQNEGLFKASTASLVSQLHAREDWRPNGNHNYQKIRLECAQVAIDRNRSMASQRVNSGQSQISLLSQPKKSSFWGGGGVVGEAKGFTPNSAQLSASVQVQNSKVKRNPTILPLSAGQSTLPGQTQHDSFCSHQTVHAPNFFMSNITRPKPVRIHLEQPQVSMLTK